MTSQRLRHDADVGDAGLLHRIHDGGEGAERNVLIGADENRLMLRIANPAPQLRGNLINVDRIIAQEDALLLVNIDDQALFRDLLDGAGTGNIDFDTLLQNRRSDHEDDQQHQHHVD